MEIIVAITDNFVIGNGSEMPWHLPADLKHFKNITSGNTIVMGRKTWESIGRALPNRMNIVVTRQQNYIADSATIIHNLMGLTSVKTIGTVFLIGGGELYRLGMEHATKLHITRIHATIDGDTFFPKFNTNEWSLESSSKMFADSENHYDMTFETWSRA